MDLEKNGIVREFTDVDNLAIICMCLMALSSVWWVQAFNLAMIVLYAVAHRADWKADNANN